MVATTAESKEVREIITWHAYVEGMKSGAVAATVMGAGVLTAHKNWTKFRTSLGVSGKTALVVSAFLGAFVIVSDKHLIDGSRNPDAYLATMDKQHEAQQVQDEAHKLKWWQSAANYIYDSPLRAVTMIGVPLVGGIYAVQASNVNIKKSQQILNTRVYGQGSVVVLLLATMGFHDYMRKHGKFGGDGDQHDQSK